MFKGNIFLRGKVNILLVLLLLGFLRLDAQDVNFSQYFNNPTYFNPAYVGLTVGLKTRLNVRKQWTGLDGEYHAYVFSMDVADRNIPGAGGLGVLATSDVQGMGLINSTTFGIIPSVRIPITRYSIFQLGALVSVVSRQLNWNNLVFGDQLDPVLGNIGVTSFRSPGDSPIVFPDFSIGGIYQFKGDHFVGNMGFAVHHLTQPDQSFLQDVAPLPRKIVAHMDVVIDFQRHRGFYYRARSIKVNPGIMYQNQAYMSLFAMGVNTYVAGVYFGLWYRHEVFRNTSFSNFVWLAGVNIPVNNDDSRLKLMYSFDMNISGKTNFTGPSHEVSLILELDNIRLVNPAHLKVPSRSRNTLECSPF
jgi:type IX secretion system PorP/SprF family membrane protein